MKDKSIPLTKAAFKKQVSRALIKNGLSPEYYFKKVNLPCHDQVNPESLLPHKPLWDLLNLVALDARIPDFGAQVAEITPWYEVDSIKPLIGNCTNLEELLQNICRIAPGQSNQIKLELIYDKSELWFLQVEASVMNGIQMELYRITSMIQLVKLAAGPGWYPDKIDSFMPPNNAVKHSRFARKSQMKFSQARSGFPIPNKLLKLSVNLETPDTKTTPDPIEIYTDFVKTIRHLIGAYIHNKDCSIDEISMATGISKRTLQRKLKNHGTSFIELRSQAKFIMAKNKLENSTTIISEIAFQLGYSDPAHFNHAFNRWAGMSPSKFRAGCLDKAEKTV